MLLTEVSGRPPMALGSRTLWADLVPDLRHSLTPGKLPAYGDTKEVRAGAARECSRTW